jgi:hypothetical protein
MAVGRDYKCVCVVKQLGAGVLAGWRQVPRLCWTRPAELVPGFLGVELDIWLLCSEEACDASSGRP